MIVLDRPRIEDLAHKAAKVAHTVLGLDDKYSIVLYEKPEMPCDAYFNTYHKAKAALSWLFDRRFRNYMDGETFVVGTI